ncbi:MAG: flippase-like domain-containing protein [Candidatus Kerfeldbacteria bacterium]
MKISRFNKFSLFFLATLIVILILVKFSELEEIIKLVRQTNWLFIGIAIFFQSLTYFALAGLYKAVLKILQHSISFKKLSKLAVASTFLNQMLPSAGLVSLTLITSSLKKEKIDKSESTLTAVVGFILIGSIYLCCLIVSITYLLLYIEINKTEALVLAAILVLTIVIIFCLVYLLRHKKTFYALAGLLSRIVNRVARIFNNGEYIREQEIIFFVDGFFLGIQTITKNKKRLIVPCILAALFFFSDIFTIFFIFLSFGLQLNLGIIIIGSVLADALGFAVAVPTSLGVFEVSMAGIYSTLGVPLASAVFATLMYRAVSFWLPIPIGFLFYRNLIKEKKK